MWRSPYFDAVLFLTALLTGLFLWWAQAVLPAASAQMLYRVNHEHWQNLPLWLSLLPKQEAAAVALMNLLGALSLWLFARISLFIGLGYRSAFALFLLLNFNPEYNDARLNIELAQYLLPCVLLSIYFFLKQYHRVRALWYSLLPLWLGALLSPVILLWNLCLPLLYLPLAYAPLRQRVLHSVLYYFVATALCLTVPSFHEFMSEIMQQAGEQFARASFEMSIFFSADNNVELGRGEAYVLSLVLILANVMKIGGIVLTSLWFFALWKRFRGILSASVQRLFMILFWAHALLSAFWLMYMGYVFSDLVYLPLLMLALWLSAPAVMYLLNRPFSALTKLLAFWSLSAYALASMMVLGPAPHYLREAGEWATSQPAREVFSNSREALFYAGANPDKPLFNIHFVPDYEWNEQDLILYRHSRKEALPEAMELYRVEAEFQNAHGDKVYALRLNLPQP